MPYAVMLLLDTDSDRFVRNVWARLAIENIAPYMASSGYAPHITLAGLPILDQEESVLDRMKTLAQKTPPVPILFHGLGIFANTERVAFLAATMTDELRTVHRFCHADVLATAPDSPSYYAPARWAPHCTLAFAVSAEDIGRTVNTLITLGCGAERRANAERIALVETPSARLLAEFPLIGMA